MKQPPRSLKQPLLSRSTYLASFTQGAVVLAITLIVFMYTLNRGNGDDMEARTLSFAILVIGNIMLILTNLSWEDNLFQILERKNMALRYVVLGAFGALTLVLFLPFFRSVFHFSFLHGNDLLGALGAGIISVAWFEGLKVWRRKQNEN